MKYLPLALLFGVLTEIALMIVVGRMIGVFPVLALLMLSAFVGVAVIRGAGFSAADAFTRMNSNAQFAADAAVVSFLRLISGILLIVPGFLSDVVGLALLAPPVGRLLTTWIGKRIIVNDHGGRCPTGPVIDGDAVEIEGEIIDGRWPPEEVDRR